MKKIPRSVKPYVTILALSFVSFLLLPILTSGCIPYFDKNTTVCSYRWNWLGGYHVINQKIHSIMDVPLEEWHNYLMYEYWALLMLILSAALIGVCLYLVLPIWHQRTTTKNKTTKKRSNGKNAFVLPLGLLLVTLGMNWGAYKAVYARNYEEMRIMAPGEGIFVPGVGVVPSDVNGTGPQACMNNPGEYCVLAPSVDLYPSQGESMQNPEYKPDENSIMKEIGGVLTASSDNTITIKTTTGKLYNITFPVDVIGWWSQNRSAEYGGYQLSNGEVITVMYLEPLNEHSTDIGPSQIFSSRFAIDPMESKSDNSTIKRYSGTLE